MIAAGHGVVQRLEESGVVMSAICFVTTRCRAIQATPVLSISDVLAWLWPETMALAWLFMALAHEILSQSHGTWLWPGPGPLVAQAIAWVM